MDNGNYYATRPIEQLERSVEGLNGIIQLLQAACCAGGKQLDEVSPNSFSSLLEVIKDDMDCSIANYYKQQN